jgi:hypothetical protein
MTLPALHRVAKAAKAVKAVLQGWKKWSSAPPLPLPQQDPDCPVEASLRSAYWETPFEEIHFFHLLLISPRCHEPGPRSLDLPERWERPWAHCNDVACGQLGAFLDASCTSAGASRLTAGASGSSDTLHCALFAQGSLQTVTSSRLAAQAVAKSSAAGWSCSPKRWTSLWTSGSLHSDAWRVVKGGKRSPSTVGG